MGRRSLTLLCLALVLHAFAAAADSLGNRQPAAGVAKDIAFDPHILVDQFGYRPGDAKVAVMRNPQTGYDSGLKYSAAPRYEVRSTADSAVVFAGAPAAWRNNAVEASSGDSGWWFDFSTVDKPGSYFIYDPQRKLRSATFSIDGDVYKKALRAAVRTYFYQRSGMAKQRPFAEQCWIDDAAYIGPGQDTEAHDITDRNNPAKVKNLSGGWFDAGDTNKYVTFAMQPVHQLLSAYQENPAAFTDDFNIPESRNGIPDLLDEIKWETDWLKRMQYADGSAALKVGEIAYGPASPPSSDRNARFYVPSCSSSTIAVAGMFAHAAYVFGNVPKLADEAADLKLRAIAAWNNYHRLTRKQTQCDTGIVHAGNADRSEKDQGAAAVVAAVYLYALTDSSGYEDYIKAHYREMLPYNDVGWSRYAPEQGESLLFYTTLPHADGALRTTILGDKLKDARAGNQIYGFRPEDDLYRDFMHDAQFHWGSNNPRAGYGNTNIDAVTYRIDAENAANYRTRALEVLHYFHGVNPFAVVYLSNMYPYGATKSVNQLFHAWFAHGSKWNDALASECGPAPGYIPGGANVNAQHDGVPASLVPPVGQPAQKSYRDWNGSSATTPENSWTINEPAIYYESGYIKLLSKFVN